MIPTQNVACFAKQRSNGVWLGQGSRVAVEFQLEMDDDFIRRYVETCEQAAKGIQMRVAFFIDNNVDENRWLHGPQPLGANEALRRVRSYLHGIVQHIGAEGDWRDSESRGAELSVMVAEVGHDNFNWKTRFAAAIIMGWQ
jgi:hypothetical protein